MDAVLFWLICVLNDKKKLCMSVEILIFGYLDCVQVSYDHRSN